MLANRTRYAGESCTCVTWQAYACTSERDFAFRFTEHACSDAACQHEEAHPWQLQARAVCALNAAFLTQAPSLFAREWVLSVGCAPHVVLTRPSCADTTSGLWQAESCDNYEAFLVACGAYSVSHRVYAWRTLGARSNAETHTARLVPAGYNVFRRRLVRSLARRRALWFPRSSLPLKNCSSRLPCQALLHQSTPSHFYKHRGNELEFSQLLNGRVLTCYLRVGERTEVELPGAL